MAVHLDENNFKSVVGGLDVAVVDFWAEWCAPCKAISPLLDELEKKAGGRLKLFKLNVDENPSVANEYGVESIPTLLVFKNGLPVNSMVGLTSKQQLEQELMSSIE